MATVSLLGRLTDNPVLKTINNNQQVVDFDLADNHGNNETTFYGCSAFGKQAELIAGSCLKGHRLYVSGTLKGRKYIGNDGKDRMSLDLTVNEFRFVESAPTTNQSQPSAPAPAAAPPGQPGAAQPQYQRDQQGNLWQLVNGQWVFVQAAQASAPAPASPPGGYAAPPGQPGAGPGVPSYPPQGPAGAPSNRPY